MVIICRGASKLGCLAKSSNAARMNDKTWRSGVCVLTKYVGVWENILTELCVLCLHCLYVTQTAANETTTMTGTVGIQVRQCVSCICVCMCMCVHSEGMRVCVVCLSTGIYH